MLAEEMLFCIICKVFFSNYKLLCINFRIIYMSRLLLLWLNWWTRLLTAAPFFTYFVKLTKHQDGSYIRRVMNSQKLRFHNNLELLLRFFLLERVFQLGIVFKHSIEKNFETKKNLNYFNFEF